MNCVLTLMQLVHQSNIPVKITLKPSSLTVEQSSIKIKDMWTPRSTLKCSLGKNSSCSFTQGKNKPTQINPEYVHFSLLQDLLRGTSLNQPEIKNSEYFKKDILPHEIKSFDQAIPNNQYCDLITVVGEKKDHKTWKKISFYNEKKLIGEYLIENISCKK